MLFLERPPAEFAKLDSSVHKQHAPTLIQFDRYSWRVGLFGPKGVGKTQLLHRALGQLPRPYEATGSTTRQTFGCSTSRGKIELLDVLDTGDWNNCVSPKAMWAPEVDGCIFPFQEEDTLGQIEGWDLPNNLKGKYILLLERRRKGGAACSAKARSLSETHGWDYQYEGDVDPFKHVIQALQARKAATTSRFSVG
ncbi:hypothetical protein PG993_008067 [Apiospora rasikravindrae]|uniref:Uncharacterized protein n=1 Tax=Apiospora rasikravindrae TaxID=990691 RepID=A0ABR1SZA8_9PEZI